MDDSDRAPPNSPDMRPDQVDSIESRNARTPDVEGDVYRTSFDDGTESVSMAVISTVAAVTDTPIEELPPLYSAIDPDQLDALFQPGLVGTVTFTYSGYTVVVHGDGAIEVSIYDGNVSQADKQPNGEPSFEYCAYCGGRLTDGNWYPVVTGTDSDGNTTLDSFCDEGCQLAWAAEE